jgi:hypothetical protein
MSAVKVFAFDGLVPRLSPTLLGDNFAQVAENVKLYSRELRYWRGPLLAYNTPGTNYKTIYRLYNPAGASAFLVWGTEVDVVPGPLADNSEGRIYFTGSGGPKKTNYALATTGSAPFPVTSYEMGVPKPAGAPAATVTTPGSGTAETRAYVFTYINTFGSVQEEGPPSDPVSVTVSPTGAVVTIDTFPALPGGSYNLTHRRIYRTVVGASTVSYQFVAEIAIGATSFADNLTTAQLGEVMSTLGWDPPPSDLAGLVALPGGALAGFSGNTVYFSEPYYPHAWPSAYAISLPVGRVVGLGVIGSSVAVMTDRVPYLIHGGVPGNMYTERVQLEEPCLSKSTIAMDEDGVIYASPNGLVMLASGARGLVTKNLFTSVEWQALNPGTMKAAVLQGRYFGLFPDVVPAKAMILSRDDPPALSYISLSATAMHVDARNARLFYADSATGDIFSLDSDESNPLQFEWRSKRWQFPQAQTFSLLRVDAEFDQLVDASAYNQAAAEVAAANAAAYGSPLLGAFNETPLNVFDLNGSTLRNPPTFASSRTVQVVIYGEGAVVANLNLSSMDPIRIPPFKVREMEIGIFGNIHVRSLALATTIEELRQI